MTTLSQEYESLFALCDAAGLAWRPRRSIAGREESLRYVSDWRESRPGWFVWITGLPHGPREHAADAHVGIQLCRLSVIERLQECARDWPSHIPSEVYLDGILCREVAGALAVGANSLCSPRSAAVA